jgi:chaperonin GroEL
VAKAINYLRDEENIINGRLKNIGAKLLIDAAERTNEESGDGTTSCTVIAKAFLLEGLKYKDLCPDLNQFRLGIKSAVKLICTNLERNSLKIT